ncbi:Protein-S-isoprenylcysteine O-methyltransferase Ste14 [Limimaricola pyoseonensis]|uniref:Protein-S-isoprenylcysteine O-methyltransferase Ste14 n=2 Tax=Limimaricola pyoseonensis TaxID=521013 RepID=A0A1G7DMS0_9RHOB|nr:isoprenylcysteine carboxylmethyltransferase family protein [Limimaricola pyoseonensis]SDE52436.1 Protein-S-isoprenylcysteine O-methyltransferase Ste14 [Limimaricola pyoseonensis]
MSKVEIPPAWLALCLAAAWIVAWLEPTGLGFGTLAGLAWWVGLALIVAGVGLMLWAVRRMLPRGTPVMPRRTPEALVTDGPFRFSRNPIYLGDALVLAGAALMLDAPLALPLVPLFAWILTRRFIRGEEAALRARFPQAFAEWSARTRRWL